MDVKDAHLRTQHFHVVTVIPVHRRLKASPVEHATPEEKYTALSVSTRSHCAWDIRAQHVSVLTHVPLLNLISANNSLTGMSKSVKSVSVTGKSESVKIVRIT